MNSAVQTIFGLLGGLAVFIYGMNMMSECLQKVAGEKMKSILALLTKNPILGVLAGALTTAVLQSSSATTVMAIGFVSAGLMNLPQAISIILGANIGTTMTAQIIAFKISDYIYVFVFLGFLVSFLAKSERIKNIGLTIFAFGLLFLGIETMGSVMKPLASSPVFTSMIGKVAHIPVLGVLVGTLMTLVVQSSSATIAVLQNFASQPAADGVSSVLGLAGAIPILLGDNIGTTITALLASVGQPKNAKRTAVAHCVFNISGCLIFIWLVKPFAKVIQMISPKGPEIEVISRQIANAHTCFNITMTLLWIPFIWLMVKIVMRIIPDSHKGMEKNPSAPLYLDEKIIGQPAAALNLVAKEVIHCADIANEIILGTMQMANRGSKKKDNEILEKAGIVQKLNGDITEYLAAMFSAGVLTEEQATQTAGLMSVMCDIDRISFLCAEVSDSFEKAAENKQTFSKEASENLQKSLHIIETMYSHALEIMTGKSTEDSDVIWDEREKVLDLDIHMRKEHMSRVAEGKCAANMTAPLNSLLHSIGRIGNSCVNIAEAVSGTVNFGYFSGVSDE